MKNSIYAVAFAVLFLSACKTDPKKAESNEMNNNEMQMGTDNHDHSSMDGTMQADKTMDATTQKSDLTSAIIDGYLVLKNALIKDDSKKAAEGAKMMLTAFSNFEMGKLSESQHSKYMEIAESAKEHAEHIAKNPLEHQREHFEDLSKDVNELISLVGTDKTLYQDFCPMASNNKGAIWLSESKEINNPYFGSKMLKCGSVQKQIN
ncbi:MAG: heavy metal transporter [Bacteroidetes bacterium HGW-Bacteroidetes-3]|jgi:hypothetical protein|nr:MAG: heavy metal transporter [Bacteroidetes bacterium HGW-Bacteroidetes-3]